MILKEGLKAYKVQSYPSWVLEEMQKKPWMIVKIGNKAYPLYCFATNMDVVKNMFSFPILLSWKTTVDYIESFELPEHFKKRLKTN